MRNSLKLTFSIVERIAFKFNIKGASLAQMNQRCALFLKKQK